MEKYVIDFTNLSMPDVADVGGKNASLGEMLQNLSRLGLNIPTGFATTVLAFREFLAANELDNKIYALLNKLDIHKLDQLKKTSGTIKKWILAAEFDADFTAAVRAAYDKLSGQGKRKILCAVRSSANAEDSPEASFAGQHDTFLNVSGSKNILFAIKKVFASLFNERAIVYRIENGFEHEKVGISAGVQMMVRSDLAASGVMFTLDTESGFDKVVSINAAYGLGESVVQGLVNPDEFYAFKPNLENDKFAILQRKLGSKKTQIVFAAAGSAKKNSKNPKTTKTISVSASAQNKYCINDAQAQLLAKQALMIEKHYGKPMDVEWAKDGVDGKIYIVQARPETVKSKEKKLEHQILERYSLENTANLKIKLTGSSVGQKIGQGPACVIRDPKKMKLMKKGMVLVADITDPDWEPIMKLASAIVTNRGGRTCHAAIIARELGIPAVVGCGDATKKIGQNEKITVSCAAGETGYVYEGLLPIKVEKTKIEDLPPLPVKLCLNLADPSRAFAYQFLPNDGVGLVRMEFIISNMIGIHPKALLNFKKLPKKIKDKIAALTSAYANPVDFYVEKLREGLSTIAAAFYPKQIIVRFSDFKTNEYANLLGGEPFEPKEENPMLGFRGGSRYLSELFADCFALECEAIRKIRNEMDLTNLAVMFPFVRTVAETKDLIALLEKNGLTRGVNDLKVILMCEVPSTAILAEDFLELCDGFSIGSNDLTQLTLGLDRDSNLVAKFFDERNAAVKKLLHEAISACNKKGKYIGICGQAPSDYPDFAAWLIDEKIQAISLNPDSIISTWLHLAEQSQIKK